jgi:hypothetical protein
MRCSQRRSMLAYSLVLLSTLLLSTAGCSKPAQEAAPATGAQPAGAPQAPAGAAVAPGQPAESPAAAPATASGQAASAPAATTAAAPGQPAAAPAQPAPPAPVPPRRLTLAEGTVITVRTVSALSTDTQASGNTFKASLAEPIVEGDWVVAREGSEVEGVVVASTKGGRVKGTAELEVAVTGLTLSDGQRIRLETSMAAAAAKSEKKKDIGKVAVTTGAGAIIGAIAGGGKGAAIGAAVGGAGGTAVVMGTRGGPAVIPGGSELHFKLKAPVEITEKK